MAFRPRTPSYTLTFDDAVEIHLRLWRGEFQSRIAFDYDVHPGRISEINTGIRHTGSADVARKRMEAGDGSKYLPREPGKQLKLAL